MTLADDIRAVDTRTQAAFTRALDYHYQSVHLWDLLVKDVRAGRTFAVTNPARGTAADQAAVAAAAQEYVKKYLTPATFQQLVTTFEAFLFDLLALWLTAYPGSLFRKQIDLETVLAAADKADVLRQVIERELNEVKYRRAADWFEYLRKLLGVPGPTADEVGRVAEAKAGRDILVHAQGVANAVYVAKAGGHARYAAGDILELPEPYLRGVADLSAKIAGELSAGHRREGMTAVEANMPRK